MKRRCPGCGLLLEDPGLPGHPSLGAGPACWDLYVGLLEWLATRPGRDGIRQIAVDTYAAQHPGSGDSRARQSVALHLIGLHLALELDSPPVLRPAQYSRLVQKNFDWPRLEPPALDAGLTVREILDAPLEGRPGLIREWAEQVWRAWQAHHETVRGWWRTLGA